MDEEERFLKARQERDEMRANRSKEASLETQQRLKFESEMTAGEAEITALLKSNQTSDAQKTLDGLRALAQDTSSTIKLTAHEMARSNAAFTRLQQEIDQITAGGAGGGRGKRFQFSSKAKAKVVQQTPVAACGEEEHAAAAAHDGGDQSTVSVSSFQPPAHGDVYGPHTGPAPLFIYPAKAVFVRECTDTTILAQPIAGSAFFFGCRNCRIYLACHQLRMKDCHNVEVYVWCASKPIVEMCDGMAFGPYACWTGLLESPLPGTDTKATSTAQWVRDVGDVHTSEETENNYTNVDDFQWLRKTQSPHWRVLAHEEQKECGTTFLSTQSTPSC